MAPDGMPGALFTCFNTQVLVGTDDQKGRLVLPGGSDKLSRHREGPALPLQPSFLFFFSGVEEGGSVGTEGVWVRKTPGCANPATSQGSPSTCDTRHHHPPLPCILCSLDRTPQGGNPQPHVIYGNIPASLLEVQRLAQGRLVERGQREARRRTDFQGAPGTPSGGGLWCEWCWWGAHFLGAFM